MALSQGLCSHRPAPSPPAPLISGELRRGRGAVPCSQTAARAVLYRGKRLGPCGRAARGSPPARPRVASNRRFAAPSARSSPSHRPRARRGATAPAPRRTVAHGSPQTSWATRARTCVRPGAPMRAAASAGGQAQAPGARSRSFSCNAISIKNPLLCTFRQRRFIGIHAAPLACPGAQVTKGDFAAQRGGGHITARAVSFSRISGQEPGDGRRGVQDLAHHGSRQATVG